MTKFPIDQLERLARKRLPGYLDACRACAVEVTDKVMAFDTSLPCWNELARFRKPASRGIGDTFAKAIQAVTLGKVTPCPKCKKRQAALNKILPYSSPDTPGG